MTTPATLLALPAYSISHPTESRTYTEDLLGLPRERALKMSTRQIRRRAKRAAAKAAKLNTPKDTIYTYTRPYGPIGLIPSVHSTSEAKEVLALGYPAELIIEQLLNNTELTSGYIKAFVKKHTPTLLREVPTAGEA